MTTAKKQDATVYLVDDDPAVLKMLQALVATIGVNVRAFASAGEFLAAYRTTPCECLVCGLRMPEIDGMRRSDRKSTRLNSSHSDRSRMPSSA